MVMLEIRRFEIIHRPVHPLPPDPHPGLGSRRVLPGPAFPAPASASYVGALRVARGRRLSATLH